MFKRKRNTHQWQTTILIWIHNHSKRQSTSGLPLFCFLPAIFQSLLNSYRSALLWLRATRLHPRNLYATDLSVYSMMPILSAIFTNICFLLIRDNLEYEMVKMKGDLWLPVLFHDEASVFCFPVVAWDRISWLRYHVPGCRWSAPFLPGQIKRENSFLV